MQYHDSRSGISPKISMGGKVKDINLDKFGDNVDVDPFLFEVHLP